MTVTDRSPSQFHLILPAGTQVVTRVEIKDAAGRILAPRGAVGEVVKAPDDGSHSYRVRFASGVEAALRRDEMTIRKHFQREAARPGEDLLAEYDLYDFVIYRCVVGSQAFGLAGEDSDIDRRGIYLPPADLQWSLYGAPEQLENEATQECYWELRKFLILALKANPNILECLYTPMVETATPVAQELLAMREIFLSKLVYQTYNGYVMSQFKKLEQDLRSNRRDKVETRDASDPFVDVWRDCVERRLRAGERGRKSRPAAGDQTRRNGMGRGEQVAPGPTQAV